FTLSPWDMMKSPLNLRYQITLSYLFHVAMAMDLRTLLDEAQDTEVEASHSGNTNFFVNLCA
ncbi:hypothetical protein SJU67_17175, partial [Aeromonas caviae]|uniref:hypothetical protein n=1 Tax=Aeromonas caviae TaxID=648 RepID=UPI0029D97B53